VCVIKQAFLQDVENIEVKLPVQSRRNNQLHASAEFTLGYVFQSLSSRSYKGIPGRLGTLNHLTRRSED
jgi:hypothetical protein